MIEVTPSLTAKATLSGQLFDLATIGDGYQFDIVEIAHSLANQCRFTGHTSVFYSVAQHSVMVSHLVPDEDALAALLHDAAEAFTGDISTPLKAMVPELLGIEAVISNNIFNWFGVSLEERPSIKRADMVALATEVRDLLPYQPVPWSVLREVKPLQSIITPLSPDEAKDLFLLRYSELAL